MNPKQTEIMRLLTELVSEQSGVLQMLEAVALGLLDELSADPRISGAVTRRLEESYSRSLAQSANVIEHEELDAVRLRLLGAMASARRTAEQPEAA